MSRAKAIVTLDSVRLTIDQSTSTVENPRQKLEPLKTTKSAPESTRDSAPKHAPESIPIPCDVTALMAGLTIFGVAPFLVTV